MPSGWPSWWPGQWAPGGAEGSFLARFLDGAALPAVEPLAEAAPTAVDDSPTGRDLTGGYPYAGYGHAYLDVLADRFR